MGLNAMGEEGLGTYAIERGKWNAFTEVAERRRGQLIWLAERMTKNREEAEDVVQEALLKAYKNLDRFRGDAQMGTWIAVIVRNTGREWLRRQKRRVGLPLEEVYDRDEGPQMMDYPDPGQSPEQLCAHEEMSALMFTEIDALDSVCKGALELCALGELSHVEAAQALGVNVFTIKSRVFHGKKMLKRAIESRLGREPSRRFGQALSSIQ